MAKSRRRQRTGSGIIDDYGFGSSERRCFGCCLRHHQEFSPVAGIRHCRASREIIVIWDWTMRAVAKANRNWATMPNATRDSTESQSEYQPVVQISNDGN